MILYGRQKDDNRLNEKKALLFFKTNDMIFYKY